MINCIFCFLQIIYSIYLLLLLSGVATRPPLEFSLVVAVTGLGRLVLGRAPRLLLLVVVCVTAWGRLTFFPPAGRLTVVDELELLTFFPPAGRLTLLPDTAGLGRLTELELLEDEFVV